MKIIDAHMHPFSNERENLKWYGEKSGDFNLIIEDMKRAGISFFCGSVISRNKHGKEALISINESAFELYKEHSDVYLPGVVIHPDFKDESCEYIKKAHDNGIFLVGELTPYVYGWKRYMDAVEIFEYAASMNMTISCHPTVPDDMHALASQFKDTEIVYAHPSEGEYLKNNIELLQKHDNVYLDLSGSGIHRYGVVRELINKVGSDRILFGTDYPICNPACYVSCIMYENLTDNELELIMHKNAERVYKL